jgi:hypothetical protein
MGTGIDLFLDWETMGFGLLGLGFGHWEMKSSKMGRGLR